MRHFGLRPRLLAALVLTAVVTLGVAALALLSPLEHRLRSEGESTVLTAVSTSRTEFEDIAVDRNSGALDSVQAGLLTRQLARRAAAQVSLLDPQLNLISQQGPDLDLPVDFSDVRRALVTGHGNYSLRGNDLYVAEPVRIGGRLYGLALRRRLQYVSSAFHVVQTAFLEAAGVGLITALLLGIGLTTTLLRRLERLRDATRELERKGLDAPQPADGSSDEIGELARAFASMQARLRRQEAARRAFVATASHELRTPLTSLDGMLELLEDDLHSEHLDLEDARERTVRAREQSRRLSHLASDLLDLSRLDAEVEMRSEPLELGELCRAVAAEFELRASEQRAHLNVGRPSAPCWVAADPGAVARIVRILLDNALRVAPADSTIDIEMTAGKRWAAASVHDRGPGVPEAERVLIFERFQRGTATGGKSGFGLGLAIGRELAERMGGSLELGEGPPPPAGEPAGARFVLRLPVAALAGENGAEP